MRDRVILIIFLVMPFIPSVANSPATLEIFYWNMEDKLTWDNFAAHPDYDFKDVAALTASGILHYTGCKDGKIIYEVHAYFDPAQSWVKHEALTDYHLDHEQLHFDITELFARKLRKNLEAKTFYCDEEEAFQNYIQTFLNKWRNEQMNYDLHTQYSMDHDAQHEWATKIRQELLELEAYAF